ncbi:MAG: TolC family protein [Lewinellaceae bacterium]|nr:TolC family protein [Lewinellaceae bacterium]
MNSKKFSILFLLLLPLGLGAQEPASFSLEEAIRYAYENNLNLKNAQIKVADARQQIIERRAVGIPQLRGSVAYNYFIDIPTQIIPNFLDPTAGDIAVQFGTKNSLTAGLNLSIKAFDASYLVGLKAAKMYREYAALEMGTTRQSVKYQVVDAYLPALLIEENVKILDKNIENLDKLVTETRALFKEGFVEQLDVDRLELSLANLKTERESIARQKEVALNALKFALGYPMDQPISVTEELTALSPTASESDLTGAVNYTVRPEYTLVSKGEELNGLNVRLNRSGYIPTLDLFGSYQQSMYANKLSDGKWFPTTIVGAQLNVPIFDGFGKKAKIERSKLDLEVVRNQKMDLERAIDLEVQNARATYLNAQDRLDSQKRNLELAERIYQTTQIKYKEGVGSSIEITQAEQSLYQTQQLYIQALYDQVTARISLDKALGR